MPILGIDLGTTNSLVAVMRPQGPEVLANELGEELLPSAVAVAEDGALLVGRAAKDRLVTDPAAGRAFFKRDMGTAVVYKFGGRSWTPVICSALVLKELKRIAETRLGEPAERAVISVPAYFHEPKRRATMEAAKIAGLTVERIVNEPTAATLAYGWKEAGDERRFLVFDLGGGTFDVTVVHAFEGVIEVQASAGENQLGGEDYTDALLESLVRRLGLKLDPLQRGRARQQVEAAKRNLSRQEAFECVLAGAPVTVTRRELHEATRHLTGRLHPVVTRCLRDAGLSPEELEDVLLVGGASRMADVRAYVYAFFGRPGNFKVDPDKAVALGAAVQAALAERAEAVRDLVLTDVCPHTLGIEVSKSFAPSNFTPGFFFPMIDRNTVVPVSRVERMNTLHPDQDVIEVKIYQGESRRVEENTLLGKMTVKGLRRRPGQKNAGEIDVRFSYDMNGILEVEVAVVEGGKKLTHVIEERPGAMTRQEVEKALARLQPLKTHPRDLPVNRARLERAYRLYPELSGESRDQLAALLDLFEAALESQDPVRVEAQAVPLDGFLSAFYLDEGEKQPGFPEDEDSREGGGEE